MGRNEPVRSPTMPHTLQNDATRTMGRDENGPSPNDRAHTSRRRNKNGRSPNDRTNDSGRTAPDENKPDTGKAQQEHNKTGQRVRYGVQTQDLS